jgi:two-component system, NtrC family, response regulator AtoC
VIPVENTIETMRLLVVSREMAALRPLWSIVESNTWHVETAASAWEALDRIQSGVAPHVLILDLPRGDGDSLHILRWLRRLRPELPTILMCHAADADHSRDAIRLGADEVLVRPIEDEQLELAFHRLARFKDVQSAEIASENIEPLGDGIFFVSASPLMQKLRTQAELLAEADIPVLILGEDGSGKETAARLIHRLSVRSGFRFLKVNCAALPSDLLEKELFGVEAPASGSSHPTPGKFELADKGTLLIDDLTEMPNYLQARLLDVLQNRRYSRLGSDTLLKTDVRILASTSANIEHALAEKKLREDLYYRLSDVTVHVPPLRKRKEEVPVRLQQFMHGQAKHYGLPSRAFSPKVIDACQRYSWPGNLAELKTFVKRYLVAGESDAVLDELDPRHHGGADSEKGAHHLPGHNGNGIETAEVNPKSLKSLIQDIKSETERSAIGVALEKTRWNRKAAARLLSVSYRSLLYKIEQYHLKSPEPFMSSLTGSTTSLSGPGTKAK